MVAANLSCIMVFDTGNRMMNSGIFGFYEHYIINNLGALT